MRRSVRRAQAWVGVRVNRCSRQLNEPMHPGYESGFRKRGGLLKRPPCYTATATLWKVEVTVSNV